MRKNTNSAENYKNLFSPTRASLVRKQFGEKLGLEVAGEKQHVVRGKHRKCVCDLSFFISLSLREKFP